MGSVNGSHRTLREMQDLVHDGTMTRQDGNGSGETALILAAERLFAEHGIEGVSLRQVNQAARHRNSSAAHYHFGSKEGLVQAVLMHRLPLLDQRRAELLEGARADSDVRFYLECFIVPLTEQLCASSPSGCYLRFIQQYEKYRGDYDFVRRITPAGVRIFDALEQLLDHLPADVRRFRIDHLVHLVHAILAHVEDRLARGLISHVDAQGTAANMVDMIAAALTAPCSDESSA